MDHVPPTVLRCRGLAVGYRPSNRSPRVVLRGLDPSIRSGELIALLGRNGAGKSTLLRTLAGLQAPLEGEIWIAGEPLRQLDPSARARQVAVVLTERVDAHDLRVREMVALGRYPYTGWSGKLRDLDDQCVDQVLRDTAAADLADRRVSELSDGERQKCLIARALAQQTPLLLLDEPTAYLDLVHRVEILRLLRRRARATGQAVLLSTHDLELALRGADRLWVLDQQGQLHADIPEQLVLDGVLERIFSRPDMSFDPSHGGLRIYDPTGPHLAVFGPNPERFWTARALRRLGFCVEDEPTDANDSLDKVEIAATADQYRWTFTQGGLRRDFDSLTALVAHLGTIPLRDDNVAGAGPDHGGGRFSVRPSGGDAAP